jgi:hypothetical protein
MAFKEYVFPDGQIYVFFVQNRNIHSMLEGRPALRFCDLQAGLGTMRDFDVWAIPNHESEIIFVPMEITKNTSFLSNSF